VCGAALRPGWHADHVTPVSTGGGTAPANGRALCPRCNLVKGARPA
jgi:5-methylcytosine-specific restriction endonuclease McrA